MQRRLNRLYSRLSPDLVRDPVSQISQIEQLLAEGREQVNDSGYMRIADHWMESARDDITVSAYVDLQLSYAHIAKLTPGQRTALAQSIREAVSQHDNPAKISMATLQYTCASQPITR